MSNSAILIPSKTWNPPKQWVYGQCQDCGKRFTPKLPKQYWCYGCRFYTQAPSPEEMEDAREASFLPRTLGRGGPRPVREGLIRMAMKQAGIWTYRELANKTGCAETTLRAWNAGGCPVSIVKPLKLARILNTSLDNLFSDEIVSYLMKL